VSCEDVVELSTAKLSKAQTKFNK